MSLIKKHVDTVIVLGGILTSVLWMNHKFTQVDDRFAQVELKIKDLDKEMGIMKAVMMVQGNFPKELVKSQNIEKKNQNG